MQKNACSTFFSQKFVKIIILIIMRSYVIGDVIPYHTALITTLFEFRAKMDGQVRKAAKFKL